MASAPLPIPPQGYKVDPKPPAGYVPDSPTAFSKTVNSSVSAPISPDLEDRRTPTLGTKLAEWGNSAHEEWDAIKSEPWFTSSPTATPPLDISFYNPAKDASRQTPTLPSHLEANPRPSNPANYFFGGEGPVSGSQKVSKQTTPAPMKTQKEGSNSVLQQVISENPGLAKTFNTDNTSVVFARGDRAKRGLKERGGLEYWSPSDNGFKDFPHPSLGKHVLEIYSDELKNDPKALKTAIYGDLMHGMNSDSYWKNLRGQFMQSFTPQETKRQEQRKTWWGDVNGSKDKNGPTYDAYIRGWITNEGEGKKWQIESGNTMYSPKQIEILGKMQKYLQTGKSQ